MTTKQRREQKAIETIIACTLRGWTAQDWNRVFAQMDGKAKKNLVKKWPKHWT